IGLISTAAAVPAVDAYVAFGAAGDTGVGAAYAAKQLFAGTVYSALTYGTLKSLPGTLSTLNGANSNRPSSYLPTALSLSFNVGPTYIGGYVGALSDIYQFLSMLNQGLTSLMTRTSTSQPSGSAPVPKSSGGSSVSGSHSTTQGSSSNNGGFGSTHSACG